jgi:tyrosine-protein phosphatase non-receptor type 13 protein
VPEEMEELRRMLGELMKYDQIVIHCSAGLGRSGVVAVLLAIMVQMEISNRISIFGTARRLREHRFGAIQNNEQYSFIYRFLSSLPK